ncbi:MAG: hypothetical protein E3J90_03970 [Promethearchaeota archaeon]|nr:MAG: hypothetical protein E3J90_03970 [Candidatus Lokiarchaeota archaeon]
MVEKAQMVKSIVSQKTLDSKKIKVSSKGEKTQYEFCKKRYSDVIKHLQKCHRNPDNAPKIEVDCDNLEQYQLYEKCLIKNPITDKMKEFNQILAPKGNPFKKFEEEMLNYAHNLTKAHKDKMIHQKLDEILNRN